MSADVAAYSLLSRTGDRRALHDAHSGAQPRQRRALVRADRARSRPRACSSGAGPTEWVGARGARALLEATGSVEEVARRRALPASLLVRPLSRSRRQKCRVPLLVRVAREAKVARRRFPLRRFFSE